MKALTLLVFALLAARVCAADGVAVFQAGLRAYQANGPDALLNTWYSLEGEQEEVAELRQRLKRATASLGPVVDTQVFAPRDLGRHVQRLYGVIYFERRPLWVRAEYYAIGTRSGFIALEFSLHADDILPLTFAHP